MHLTRTFVRTACATAALALTLGGTARALGPDVDGAAKREGTVVWYASVDTRALGLVVSRFEKLHPDIRVQAVQMTSSLIPARVMTEQQSGRSIADLVSGDDFSLSQLAAAGVLQPCRPKEPERFVKGAVDPNGFWTTLYDDTTVIAWNPRKLKADGLKPPTSLADFAKPEWAGKLGIDSSAYNWYSGTMATQPNAAELLKKIAANRPFITAGHTQSIAQLAAGEFDATPTAYAYMAETQRKAGAAIDFVRSKPMIIGLVPIAMVRDAPHPNAARVLFDWLVSKDGQQYFVDASGRTSARTDVRNDPRVFDAKQPFFVVPAPDRERYNAMVRAYKTLLGMTT
jgi:iron(III) transport system substrate-binding protein